MTEETARLRNEVITILLQMQRIAGTEADRIDEDEKAATEPYMVQKMGEPFNDPTLNLDAFKNEKQD